MVMEGYYFHDQKPELGAKINSLHLRYLEMEESPQKLEHRSKLVDCIKKFLCIAPHNQKFCFKETAEVLHRSASNKKDFSGYKAAPGWNAIGMYAENLISQPWRQEYRQIKMYSGFYKHQIEANLVGAEIMFEVMGYKHAGDGIMILEGPVCPDTVKCVSQDSLVAYVECQILKEIWEELSASYKVSWLDVLEFREAHLCSPKKAIEGLKYQILQRQEQQRSYPQTNNEYIANNCRYPVHQHLVSPTIPTNNHSFPLQGTQPHLPVPLPPPQCVYNNYYPNTYTSYGVVSPVCNFSNPNVYAPTIKQPYNGGYYCNGYVPQTCMVPVPTAQLIEIEAPPRQSYDIIDGTARIQKTNFNADENYSKDGGIDLKMSSPPKIYDKDEVTGTYESWDYVYRNLESQGYSKDLGERGDVLSSNRRESRQHREPELKVSDRPMKINEALEKLRLHDKAKKVENVPPDQRRLSSDALSSSYDNLSTQDFGRKVKSKSTIAPSKFEEVEPQTSHRYLSKTLDLRKTRNSPASASKLPEKIVVQTEMAPSAPQHDSNKWQCSACTYLNDDSKRICDICSKSRVVVDQEMEIGGSECPKCTLVNPKSNKNCEACGTNLEDSPTYI